MIDNSEEYNDEVRGWTKNLMEDLKDELDALGVQHYKYSPNKTPLRKALRSKVYQRGGMIYKIGISMPRSAVFLHKGVSKYHPKTSPRTPKPWFNPVVDRNMPNLLNIAARRGADFVVNHIYIK